jgi:hypothetical protein
MQDLKIEFSIAGYPAEAALGPCALPNLPGQANDAASLHSLLEAPTVRSSPPRPPFRLLSPCFFVLSPSLCLAARHTWKYHISNMYICNPGRTGDLKRDKWLRTSAFSPLPPPPVPLFPSSLLPSLFFACAFSSCRTAVGCADIEMDRKLLIGKLHGLGYCPCRTSDCMFRHQLSNVAC